MSEIATLAKLELHLSQSPNHGSTAVVKVSRPKRSLLEDYFSEIQYASFGQNGAAAHTLTTNQKPQKHNAGSGYQLTLS